MSFRPARLLEKEQIEKLSNHGLIGWYRSLVVTKRASNQHCSTEFFGKRKPPFYMNMNKFLWNYHEARRELNRRQLKEFENP